MGSSLLEDNSHKSYVLVLLMGIVLSFYCGVRLPSFYIQGGRGFTKGNRVSYNMIPIRTLSLLAYFTHIFIDIIIYAFGCKP
jgi:hypothetical protein